MDFNIDKEMRELIFCLLKEDNWITGDELSIRLGWNKKKIQNIIRRLSEKFGSQCVILSKKNRGYLLVGIYDELKRYLMQYIFYNDRYFNLEERKVMIILDLLFTNDYMPMGKLADKYFVSKTVIFEEIKNLKRWFGRINGLELEVSSKNGIKIHGDEMTKRYWGAAYGQLDILKLIGISQHLVMRYQSIIQMTSDFFLNEIIKDGVYISGEDFTFILRYIAMTELRNSYGFSLKDKGIFIEDSKFLLKLEEKIDYKFKDVEKRMILFLMHDSNVVSFKNKVGYDRVKIERLENFLSKKLKVSNLVLFHEKELLYHNIKVMRNRNEYDYHSINYYDKDILYKYPLSIYLATQALQMIFHFKPSRTDILDFSVYIGGIIEKHHLHTDIKVLIVGNQKFEILDQIKNVLLSFASLKIDIVDLLPTYVLEKELSILDDYDLFMTTETSTRLKFSQFIQVPVIMNYQNISLFKKVILTWNKKYNEKKLLKFKNKVKRQQLDTIYSIEDIVEKDKIQETTIYALNKKSLCIIYVGKDVQTETVLYTLKRDFTYEYQKIKKLVYISYNENEEDIVSYFYDVSSFIQSEL